MVFQIKLKTINDQTKENNTVNITRPVATYIKEKSH